VLILFTALLCASLILLGYSAVRVAQPVIERRLAAEGGRLLLYLVARSKKPLRRTHRPSEVGDYRQRD
jgi:hypothetical protein